MLSRENERGKYHRQDSSGQYQRVQFIPNRVRRQPHSCQYKRKLANLKQTQPNGQGDYVSIPEDESYECEYEPFANTYGQH